MNARTSTIRFVMLSATLLFAPASGVLWSQSQPKSAGTRPPEQAPAIDFRPEFGRALEKPKPKPSVSRARRVPAPPTCKAVGQVKDRLDRALKAISDVPLENAPGPNEPWEKGAEFWNKASGTLESGGVRELVHDYDQLPISAALLDCGITKAAVAGTLWKLNYVRAEYFRVLFLRALYSKSDQLVKLTDDYNALVDKYNHLVKDFRAYAAASLGYESFLESDIRQLEGRIREDDADRLAYQRILSNLSRPVFIQQWAPPQPVAPLTCSGSSINYGYGITTTSFNCH